jgi:hypothetical protein
MHAKDPSRRERKTKLWKIQGDILEDCSVVVIVEVLLCVLPIELAGVIALLAFGSLAVEANFARIAAQLQNLLSPQA